MLYTPSVRYAARKPNSPSILRRRRREYRISAFDHEFQPDALFYIEGPDEDGRVWICSADVPGQWCHNLGAADKVAEVLSQWLASIDDAERFRLTDDE